MCARQMELLEMPGLWRTLSGPKANTGINWAGLFYLLHPWRNQGQLRVIRK